MYEKRNIEARSSNDYCSGRAKSVTFFECVFVALEIQNAIRMRRIILPSVSCPTLQYFSTLCHKQHDFRKSKKKK